MFAMEITEHVKSKRNENAKMVKLPDNDPRCHGLEEGFCRMACDTCPFVTRPIKNEYLNKWRRQQAADKAHKVPSDAAEQPVQQSLARRRASQHGSHMQSNSLVPRSQPVPFAQFNLAPGIEANATDDMQLSARLDPMDIVGGTTTTTEGRATPVQICSPEDDEGCWTSMLGYVCHHTQRGARAVAAGARSRQPYALALIVERA